MTHLERLSRLLQDSNLLIEQSGQHKTTNIERPANDSRKVGPNDVFVAIKGEHFDGHLFIEKAVKNGAIAVVCEVMPEEALTRFPGVAFIRVHNARAALAELAAFHYNYPSRSLDMIGITGTNGKTTTAFLVHHMLQSLGNPCGLLSTIEYRIGSEILEASHTTPDTLELNRMLQLMLDQACRACVMEVSSHALDQDRVRAIDYAVGIFTNLTQDHLDYHGTMDAYLGAKKILFDGLMPGTTAVYNADDPHGESIVANTAASTLSFGMFTQADIRGFIIRNGLSGLELEIEGSARRYRLVGEFNALNLLAAYATGRALGYERDDILMALESAPPVPGRFEILKVQGKRHVVIDYAHTPDALENVLQTIRHTMNPDSILWCIFGCGGDRDSGKRPLMGQIAEQYSDQLIVTSDNPRTEDPERILDDIKKGISRPEQALWIMNRREAIQEAASRSADGDVILIAGKGHENYQVIGTETIPFDDKAEARNAFGK